MHLLIGERTSRISKKTGEDFYRYRKHPNILILVMILMNGSGKICSEFQIFSIYSAVSNIDGSVGYRNKLLALLSRV